jgi:hypothetical protein
VLELLAQADPLAALMAGLFLFAAGMFPIGIMLGSSCSPCCLDCGCTEGQLPDTVTLSVDGFQDGQTQGPDLAFLTFSSNFGSGAAGRVTAPDGDPDTDAGPITAVEITSGGSGYAVLSRSAPTLSADASPGSGATLSISYAANGTTPATWSVSGVTVTAGGSGYTDGDELTFSLGTGDYVSLDPFGEPLHATATLQTERVQPTIEIGVESTGGSGATLTPTLSAISGGDVNGRPIWGVSSVAIDDGGSGYAVGDQLTATPTDGEGGGLWYEVSAVDGGGAITAVVGYNGGEYFKDTGAIESVSVSVGGSYYKEDTTIPGQAATVTVGVNQSGPTSVSAGGAVLAAVIDTSPTSATFGQITGVTITNGGHDYLAWEWCESYVSGVTIVLPRGALVPPFPLTPQIAHCTFSAGQCCVMTGPPARFACARYFYVEYRGSSLPPKVVIRTGGCEFTLYADENVTDCEEFSFTASDDEGRSVTVTAGGTDVGQSDCNTTCNGTITIGGVELEIGDSDWTLIAVDNLLNPPKPLPDVPYFVWIEGNKFRIQGTLAYHAYLIARAQSASCVLIDGVGYLRINVLFQWHALSYTNVLSETPDIPFVSSYSNPDQDEWDALTPGSQSDDTIFATVNYFGPPHLQRDFEAGPIKGQSCINGQFKETTPPPFSPLWFPSLAEISAQRTAASVNLDCDP